MGYKQGEERSLPIGVFDSGVGGLTVLTELRKLFPNENFIYVGDTKNTPYGNREQEDIIEFALRIAEYMSRVPVKLAVIACNTVTVTALDILLDRFDFTFVPVSKGVRTALSISPKKNIGIMATAMTIASHKHRLEAKSINRVANIFEQPCPELVSLIEAGHVDDDLVRAQVKEYIDPLVEKGVDTVILGCTHYPFVRNILEDITGNRIVYVDPARETAELLRGTMARRNLENQQIKKGKTTLYFTGDTLQANTLATLLMEPKSFDIHKIVL